MPHHLFVAQHPPRVCVGQGFERELVAPVFLGNPLGNGLTDDPASAPIQPVRDIIELGSEVRRQFGCEDAVGFHLDHLL